MLDNRLTVGLLAIVFGLILVGTVTFTDAGAQLSSAFPNIASNVSTTPVSGQYSDPESGLEITFPDGWTGQKINSLTGTVILITKNATAFVPSINVSIIDKAVVDNMTAKIESFGNNTDFRKLLSMESQGVNMTMPTAITINGAKGMKMEFQYSVLGMSLHYEAFVFQTSKYFVMLNFDASSTEFEKDSVDFDKTLNTFQLPDTINITSMTTQTTQPPQPTSPTAPTVPTTTPPALTQSQPANSTVPTTTPTSSPPLTSPSQTTPSSSSPQTSSLQATSSTLSTPIQSPSLVPSETGITVSTDKSSYFVGDTVTTLVDFYGANGVQNITVSVTDPTGNTIVSNTVMTNSTGAASLQFKLPASARTGSYQVEVNVPFEGNDFGNSAVFYVQDDGSQAISNGETTKSNNDMAQPSPSSGNGFLDDITNFFRGLSHW